MNELFRFVTLFITRDVIYIFGGSSIILSFLYLFDRLPLTNNVPTAHLIFAGGFAYSIGYAVQGIFGFTPLVNVRLIFKIGKFGNFLYKLFERRDWEDVSQFNPFEARVVINESASERSFSYVERLIMLRHIGTTIGPCYIVSAIPLMVRAWRTTEPFDITLTSAVIGIGVVLILLGYLMTMQLTQHMQKLYAKLISSTNNGDEPKAR